MDGIVDLAAMDGDFLGTINAETNLVAADFDDHDRDVVVDDEALVLPARKYQHLTVSRGLSVGLGNGE